MVPRPALRVQFGADYARVRDFRWRFVAGLAAVPRIYLKTDYRNDELLVRYGDRLGNRTAFKRLGFLLEALNFEAPLLVESCLRRRSSGVTDLDPSVDHRGRIMSRWNLCINVDVSRGLPRPNLRPRRFQVESVNWGLTEMMQMIEARREALSELCHRFHVGRLDVFGSAATGGLHSKSDVDFLVEFQRVDSMTLADQYFGLLEALEELFGRKVDLLTGRSLRNPYFIASVQKTREMLYAA